MRNSLKKKKFMNHSVWLCREKRHFIALQEALPGRMSTAREHWSYFCLQQTIRCTDRVSLHQQVVSERKPTRFRNRSYQGRAFMCTEGDERGHVELDDSTVVTSSALGSYVMKAFLASIFLLSKEVEADERTNWVFSPKQVYCLRTWPRVNTEFLVFCDKK